MRHSAHHLVIFMERASLWNFLANNKLQINSKDKSRHASHTTFKNISEINRPKKILSKAN